MAKKQLFFDDGLIDVEFNGDPNRTFKFNPTNFDMFDNFYALISWIERDLEGVLEKIAQSSDSFARMGEDEGLEVEGYEHGYILSQSKLLKERFDEVFGPGCAKAAFGHLSPFTFVGGEFLFQKVISVLAPLVEESAKEMGIDTKSQSEKAAKYLEQKKAHLQNKNKKK